ncbi:hypothetical protein [Sphingobacterium sp. UT-1RO-CII-1]|uniref:hypothetical protein n=1 Tax=Sphingobacterium sp. UT-1RO-CII-1 TaxID=2995225 RepID=UPI00227D6772|nr:hypothetical protein [Sphingobacterium sp. UT-1RO-CII-1]
MKANLSNKLIDLSYDELIDTSGGGIFGDKTMTEWKHYGTATVLGHIVQACENAIASNWETAKNTPYGHHGGARP